jgi:hypothetical protein
MKLHRYYKKAAVTALVFSLVTCCGCVSTSVPVPVEPTPLPPLTTYTDEINGFSISYPQSWTKIAGPDDEYTRIRFMPQACAASYPQITVMSKQMQSGSSYISSLDLDTSCGEPEVISREESMLDYMPAEKTVYTALCGDLPVKVVQNSLVHNTMFWIVTCAGPEDSFDELGPVFDAVASSFSIRSTQVLALLPKINSFASSTDTIEYGQPAELTWNVSNADHAVIHPSAASIGTTGTLRVSPESTTTYILVATNDAGISTGSLTITVTGNGTTVGYDPVTGRNPDIAFQWEQYCLATGYQVQIANDPGFTRLVYDSGAFTPDSVTSPAMLYRAGGVLQAGHTYYWRVRITETATGQVLHHSAWSEPQRFSISPGAPVTTPYYGIQAIVPENNITSIPINSIAFAWTPYQDTEMYRFILTEDAALSNIVAIAETYTPAYLYNGTLDYNANYFWQVMALTPTQSELSATFSFRTETGPPVAQKAPEESTSTVTTAVVVTPPWAWIVIGIGCMLIILAIALIIRVSRQQR